MTRPSAAPQFSPVFKVKTLEDARVRALQTRALKALFEPASIAVIGASRREGSVGQAVFRNLLMNGYTGTLYPVNPKYPSVMGVKCYPADLDALQECLERLSQLVIEFPLIKELDINPLIAYPQGALVVDARIILGEE